MKKAILSLVLGVGMAAPALIAQTVAESTREIPPGYKSSNERFGNYPMSYFGPRTEWARPAAAGRLSVLVFAPTVAARDAVELASRLDAQVDLVVSSGNGGFDTWADDRRGEGGFYAAIPSKQALNDRTAAFLSPAYRHDAIIIGRLMWTIIPENFRQQILAKAKAGTALVFVTPWGVEEPLLTSMGMTSENPLAETIRQTVPLAMLPLDVTLPPAAGSKEKKMGPFEVQTGRLGEGRVVFVQYNDFHHYRVLKAGEEPAGVWHQGGGKRPLRLDGGGGALTPLFDFVGNNPLFYEYWYSILGKALLYATGREPAARIQPEAVSAECSRQNLPAAPVSFALAGAVRPGMSFEYEIRDRANRVIARGTQEIASDKPASALQPQFPVVPPGLYVVDAWLKRGGPTVDWASAAVAVTGPQYIGAIAADKEFFARNEAIGGHVTFKTAVPKGGKVTVELWDSWNRLEQRVELKDGETTFRFAPVAHPLARAYRVVCEAQDGKGVADRQECWTGLPSNAIDEFQFVAWDVALGGRAAQVHMRLMKEHGLTGYFDMASYLNREQLMESADILAQNNLKAWPLCYGLWSWSPKRYGDLLSGPWKEQFRKVYIDRTDAYKRYGTLAYGIDSESDYDVDETWDVPAGREDYRKYLKSRYGDIAALNKIWSASFASFDDIGFISLMEAKTGRQPTRWLEQILYKRDRFNYAAEVSAALVREFDPRARVSHDIACAPAKSSFDMPRMAKIIDAFVQSDLEHFDKRNRNRLGSGYWFGFYQNETSEWQMRTKPWESLFQGGKAIAWFPGNNAFTADQSEPYLCFKQASEEVADIRGGADVLLMSADKRVDPILILWSHNSWMAGVYHPLETPWYGAVYSFMSLLRRTGLDYECVGEDFLEEKLAFGATQRVLILPASQSISRKAVEKIKAFADAGGLVIADYKPATMDEYLRPYGAEQPQAAAGEMKSATCPKCQGKKVIHLGGPGDPLGNCPTCAGTGAVIKGGELVLTKSALDDAFDFSKKGVKPCGKGYGFFLKGAPARDDYGALRALLIEKGGAKGGLQVLDTLGNLRTDLRTYVFDSGPAMFVGMLPDKTVSNPPGEEFVLKTAKKMHAYNVRQHSYLGFTDAVPAGILPAQAKLFALLPARIEGMAVAAEERACRPGETVALNIRMAPDALKDVSLAVRIEVLKEGQAIAAYTKKLAVKGAAKHAIPLALNEAKGAYVLRVTEVISGQRQDIPITVR